MRKITDFLFRLAGIVILTVCCACASVKPEDSPMNVQIWISCRNGSEEAMTKGASVLKEKIISRFNFSKVAVRSSKAMCSISVEVPPPRNTARTAGRLKSFVSASLDHFPDGARVIGFRTVPSR